MEIYSIQFNTKSYGSGIADVAACDAQEAISTLQHEGKLNGFPDEYIILKCTKVSVCSFFDHPFVVSEIIQDAANIPAFTVVDNLVTPDPSRALSANQGYVINGMLGRLTVSIGDMTRLVTSNKANLVAAINELATIAVSQSKVVDNLNSTSTTLALSANQGRILDSRISKKYELPSDGIPLSALSPSVMSILNKASSALQEYTETDPTVPDWAKTPSKPQYTWNEILNKPETFDITSSAIIAALGYAPARKSDIPTKTSELANDSNFITEHQKLKTINGQTIIGTGNIVIEGGKVDEISAAEVESMWNEIMSA